ncbi:tetratricopeptide repeat protein [Leifsonia xyli]|uniref:tetratricopeptide repeat protein n=1 Tax=Leifsonia xyli TaxID=1575 RepID=UPI003D665474
MLDIWLGDLAGLTPETDAQTLRDTAGEYRSLGRIDDALRLLDAAESAAVERPVAGAGDPLALIHYARAELLEQAGRPDAAARALAEARKVSVARCFAGSAADAALLERRIHATGDARAHALLGHWLYFQRRYAEAIDHLTAAVAGDPADAVALRGLGLAAYNVQGDPGRAVALYRSAVEAAPDDPKLRYEADQLARRVGVAPEDRLEALADAGALVAARDDLALAYAELLVLVGRHEEAIDLLAGRRFSPWEGGEGETIRVWTLAQRAAAEHHLAAGDPAAAITALNSAVHVPDALGEAPHPLANRSDLLLAFGDAHRAAGNDAESDAAWRAAADSAGDFTTMSAVPHSPMTYYSVLAARRLGDTERAERLTTELSAYVESIRNEHARIDYFATSLPTMLIFREDIARTHHDLVAVMDAQLAILAGRMTAARTVLEELESRDPADARVRDLRAQTKTPVGA